MNIAEFLYLRGTKPSSVVAEVAATIGLADDDALLAVGSLVEGLGNSKSDLDLLLITSRCDGVSSVQDSAALIVGGCIADLRIMRTVELEELLNRLDHWSRLPWEVTHAVKFTLEERTLMHRLLHGQVLHKDKRNRVAERTPSLVELARLKLHFARQMSRTIQVDMVGYRETGDYASLVFAAQELLGHAVDALLAGYNITNPLIKWRSRLLDLVPSNWERFLTVQPTGLTASQRVWRLHRAPETPDSKLALEHAQRITTFARAVFVWAELRLVKAEVVNERPTISNPSKRKASDLPLPRLDFDVDFLLAEEKVIIARLNEFGVSLELSPREFALTLLFDGITTRREAELIAYGAQRGKATSNVIDHFVSTVTGAGLTVDANDENRRSSSRRRK